MTSEPDSDGPCPISRCADVICGKWTLLLIRDLTSGPRYFRDLERSLAGISPRTLCERLRFLTEQGFITRTYIKALPPRTQYELTSKGAALKPLLDVMRDFGTLHLQSQEVAADAAAVPGAVDPECCEEPAASAVPTHELSA